ncbi:D-alanyl-D-alanine carboxypeptidase [Patescibacteria group bacterium]|nr:D-alanyl-D-alanine carboxypeptidase [Patescibacteria group bacterium]MBU1472250.1 D-alanyl-D-alanine carboxypeptidase [Patescibacteria group bacterium]MBU2460499.1 D-alanyl-D-alanine carboxypeptidase [Patescibacteria group bacterium]MBU2543870.1 D-alanyl-D-alanine carboxypeptidase [Patescibacteria group bacterium]
MSKKKIIYKHKWWKKSWDRIVFLVFFVVFFLGYPGQNVYTSAYTPGRPLIRPLPVPMPSPAPYPVNRTGIYPGEEVSAAGVVVFDVDSAVFLYKRNEEAPLAPASTTKILTALVALDAYQLDDVMTVKNVANAGQTMGLVAGERISVENLLYGTLIQSGNDAAYALADNYPGGAEAFVAAMNVKAQDLHMSNSSFTNPVGYDDEGHKTTPLALMRLSQVALRNKTIAKMVAIPQITVSDVTHTYFHSLKNVNQLLGKIPGVGGIKTGWTEEAGENLITLIEKNGHRVIIVVLKSKDRFSDTSGLIDWVFGNYVWQEFYPSN